MARSSENHREKAMKILHSQSAFSIGSFLQGEMTPALALAPLASIESAGHLAAAADGPTGGSTTAPSVAPARPNANGVRRPTAMPGARIRPSSSLHFKNGNENGDGNGHTAGSNGSPKNGKVSGSTKKSNVRFHNQLLSPSAASDASVCEYPAQN